MSEAFDADLDKVKFDEKNPRRSFPEDELRSLGESLLRRQWLPILLRKCFTVVNGERRVRAARLVGKKTLTAMYCEDDAPSIDAQLVTALHAADLTAYEQYLGFTEWLTQNPNRTARDLASAISRDPALVSRTLALAKCVPAVVKSAEAGEIGPAHWSQIAQVPAAEQEDLLHLKLSGGTVEGLRAARRRNGNDTQKLPRVRLVLPSGEAVSVEGKELGLGEVIQLLTDLLKLARRANDERLNLKTFAAACRDRAKGAT